MGTLAARHGRLEASRYDGAGIRNSRVTLKHLKSLTADGSLPLVEISDWPAMAVRGIHLDLKYMMHRVVYLHEWLESLASYKINTLLLEYEDKFPYRRHPSLRHPAALTEKQLREFLRHARSLGLRVIPLIQTLGHVEYILKHEQFAHLRRNGYHTEYDTSHQKTLPFVRAMLDEVMEFHTEDDWFHVGGDECWSLKHEKDEVAARIYSEHMTAVLRHIVARGKRPLLWDDMVRPLSPRLQQQLFRRIPPETILCYWNYNAKLTDAECLKTYRRAGFDVLGIACHDWGPVVPYYRRCTVPNTLAMARASGANRALGMINSHWASFHCPLPLQDYGIALTAEAAWHGHRVNVHRFDKAYCRLRFGLRDRSFVETLHQLDDMLEMPTDLGRPVFLPYYYYMDAVLHYPNGQRDREKYGPVAPLEEMDWAEIVRKKLAYLEESPARAKWLRRLETFRDQAGSAERELHRIRPHAYRSGELFELVEWLARFRRHAAARMLALASGRPNDTILSESRRFRADMRRVYGRFMHARELRHEELSLFDGEEKLLARSSGAK